MIVCWSVKGGCGTTVTAAGLAIVLSRSRPTLLVDLAGDVPAALGLAEPASPGVADWLASPAADGAALRALEVAAGDSLHVLPAGTAAPAASTPTRLAELSAALASQRAVVVDAGSSLTAEQLGALGGHPLLVLRACYLAVRRAAASDHRAAGVVLVREPGRALGAADIEHAVGAPVLAELPLDPAVARAVDAGLLTSRLPRSITHPLRRVVLSAVVSCGELGERPGSAARRS